MHGHVHARCMYAAGRHTLPRLHARKYATGGLYHVSVRACMPACMPHADYTWTVTHFVLVKSTP